MSEKQVNSIKRQYLFVCNPITTYLEDMDICLALRTALMLLPGAMLFRLRLAHLETAHSIRDPAVTPNNAHFWRGVRATSRLEATEPSSEVTLAEAVDILSRVS